MQGHIVLFTQNLMAFGRECFFGAAVVEAHGALSSNGRSLFAAATARVPLAGTDWIPGRARAELAFVRFAPPLTSVNQE